MTAARILAEGFDPDDTRGLELKDEATRCSTRARVLADLQERLYAQDRWSVLLIFQALDAAGKDGTIKHVMSGLNPQGCEVHAFKAPSSEELDHDFLWRTTAAAAPRPHRHLQPLVLRGDARGARAPRDPGQAATARALVTQRIWEERFEDVDNYERYLSRQGVVIRKFFLHVSQGGTEERFLERLDEPEKNWKFSLSDVHEREHFDDYLTPTRTPSGTRPPTSAPWYVVPADHKWFTRLVVASAVIETIESLDPTFPTVDDAKRQSCRWRGRRSKARDGRGARRASGSRTMSGDGLHRRRPERRRCAWCGDDPLYVRYHDDEWGRPVVDDRRLFEKICLEGFQSGLSWITILRKRERLPRGVRRVRSGARRALRRPRRRAAARRTPASCAIAARSNRPSTTRGALLELRAEFGSLAAYVWSLRAAGSERPAALTWAALRAMPTTPTSTRCRRT